MPDYRGHEIKLQPGNFGVVLAKVYRDGHLLMVPGGDLHFAESTAEEALRRAKRWIDTKFTDAPNAADEDMDNAMELSFMHSEMVEKDAEIEVQKKEIASLKERLKLATERHQQELEDLGKLIHKLTQERDQALGWGNKGMERWGIVTRGLERVIKIAKYWRARAQECEARELPF